MWRGVWDVRRFDEIDSTNTYLMGEAKRGAAEGTAVVAGHQTAGRGRMDRRWEAPPGASLLLSVLFRPRFDPAELHLCTVAMALAAAEACRRVAGVNALLKWPNDILVGEAKLAGILAEVDFGTGPDAESEPDADGEPDAERPPGCAVVVGIGLNVDWPGPPGVGGTCLAELRGAPVDQGELLEALLGALGDRRALLDDAAGRRTLAAEMRDCCATLGRQVRVALGAEVIVGMAETIDDGGRLVIRTPAGRTTVTAGDVVHLRPG